ncbi:MAG: choline dehydrogenase [Betaproteobacteria bacterium]|nr:choline dehydrogenase [Betaproteobacteria bacterium]
MSGYHTIIVGAGSAGCVLAGRLGEDKEKRILVLEAGGGDSHYLLSVPLGVAKVWNNERFNWSYHTEPETLADNRSIYIPRGKVVGGSSSINMMAYVRGHRGDYDRWQANGLDGWSYADVLPYFRRAEKFEDGESFYRGGDGPMHVHRGSTQDPIYDAFLDSAPELGYAANNDYNGGEQSGFARAQFTAREGRRCSASVAYLRPALARGNVVLETHVHVARVLMQGTRAVGVEYIKNGRRVQAIAQAEVILSAGAINSPQLLMLSGIGPAAHLRKFGIPTVVDLASVGQNHQDHPAVRLSYNLAVASKVRAQLRLDRLALSMVRAYCFGTGFASEPPSGTTAFFKSDAGQAIPDLQLFCVNAALRANEWFPGWRAPAPDGFAMRACHLRPQSRGSIELASNDPLAAPRIRNNFLSTPGDRRALREAIKFVRSIAASKAFKGLVGAETAPGPAVRSDDEIDAYIRQTVDTIYHPLGACRMGSDNASVVDLQFRVRGTQGLRVVDASVMPDLVGGNINAPVMMIAEKAADLIRELPPMPVA